MSNPTGTLIWRLLCAWRGGTFTTPLPIADTADLSAGDLIRNNLGDGSAYVVAPELR
jgi:hypothetical protein